MRQLIAMFAVFGLIALVAFYVALAPLETSAPQALHGPVALLDEGAARIIEIKGRGTAVLALLGGGALLGLIAAMFTGRKREQDAVSDDVPVSPGPVWRPEPLSQDDRIASLRRRTSTGIAEPAAQPSEPEVITEPETDGAETSPADIADQPPHPVLFARKVRGEGGDWPQSASWFGGLPRLASAEWPRDDQGHTLPFAAQIDLAELARTCPQSPLPQSGSLAFFLGSGAVVFVPPGNRDFTQPPGDLPPAYEEGGAPLPATVTRFSRDIFPFWPVEPVAVPLSPPDRDGEARAISDMVRQRFSDPSAVLAPSADGALWWYGVFHLADQLHEAVDGAERSVTATGQPEPDEEEEALSAMAAAMDGFIANRDPWEPLTPEERDLVVEILDEIHRRHGQLLQHPLPHSLPPLQALCIRAMISGPAEAFAALPMDVLARIAHKHRVPAGPQHQIFGLGGAAGPEERAEQDLLLLQLAYDDLMEWRWEGGGVYQFRISLSDAEQGNWDRARLTFKCA